MPASSAPAASIPGVLRGLVLPVLAVLLTALGMTRVFGDPFQHEWLGHNGARYAHIARNYERFGLTHLGGAPLLDVAQAPGGEGSASAPDIYAHHPPGLSMTIAVVDRLLGVEGEAFAREDHARLVPAVATLVSIVVLAWLVAAALGVDAARGDAQALSPAWAGGLAAVALAVMPMVNLYGAHPDPQGAPVLLGSLATVLAYHRWLRGHGLLPWLVASALAVFFDWYGLYAPTLCAVHLFLTQPTRRLAALGLGGWTLLLFSVGLWWLTSLPGMSLDRLAGAAGLRGPAGLGGDIEGLGRHLGAWWSDTLRLMPAWPVLTLVLAWEGWRGLRMARSPGRGQATGLGSGSLLFLLAAPPLLHAILFPAGLLVHSYWLFGLPPALAAAVALACQRWRAPVGVLLVGLLAVAGWSAADELLAREDPVPALVGDLLARHTAPGEAVLTNFDTNPFADNAAGYVMKLPEVTFASDRQVRGRVGRSGEPSLAEARTRLPAARWFLLVGWPESADPALVAEVSAATLGEPLQVMPGVAVSLHRLAE